MSTTVLSTVSEFVARAYVTGVRTGDRRLRTVAEEFFATERGERPSYRNGAHRAAESAESVQREINSAYWSSVAHTAHYGF